MTELPKGEVHIWQFSLDLPDEEVSDLREALSDEELYRASRFRSARQRGRYTAAHGRLRKLLGSYTSVQPAEIRIANQAKGKPYLPDFPWLHFNLSHAENIGLFAFASHRQVGVDIEKIMPLSEAPALAARCFSANDYQKLTALLPEQQQIAFYMAWVRKEAYLKAIGEGLSFPLKNVEVSFAPGEPARLLDVNGHPELLKRWSLQAVEVAPGFIGAVVAEGEGWQVVYKHVFKYKS